MADLEVVIAKIDAQSEMLKVQKKRINKIEEAIGSLVVQNNMIINIQSQLDALWKKFDAAFSPEGVITK